MATGRRRLRSSTVALGSMGVLAAALTSCGSDPDKRCVDRDSYDVYKGYKVVDAGECSGSAKSSKASAKKRKGSADGDWYYDADVSAGYADNGTFSRNEAVDRDGFGCSGSGSGGG
ncbi:hypothetical protein [Streptomyces sp. GC420]|uniref:hypothetical protein n=1 Tax=Streptomyces sp. GC420 TaxID=2697568 RepID=UPI001414D93D|nr:hypothetical protein [Streptomyces sp. GC420]NBM19821.1 hypothetical protein [Streptomyces sp. GC420]